jgi:hypothetical protein
MIFKDRGEYKIALSEDEVEQSLDWMIDLKRLLETHERTKGLKDVIGHVQVAIEAMAAFSMEHFSNEEKP